MHADSREMHLRPGADQNEAAVTSESAIDLAQDLRDALNSVAGLARMKGDFVDEPVVVLHLAPPVEPQTSAQGVINALLQLEQQRLLLRGSSAMHATYAPSLFGWMASSSRDAARRVLEAIHNTIRANAGAPSYSWTDIRTVARLEESERPLAKMLATAANLYSGVGTDSTGVLVFQMPVDIIDVVHAANIDALIDYRLRVSPAQVMIRAQWRREAPGLLQQIVPAAHQHLATHGDWPTLAEADQLVGGHVATILSRRTEKYLRVLSFDGMDRLALTLTGLQCAQAAEADQQLVLRLLRYLGDYSQRNALESVSARVMLGAFADLVDDDARTAALERAIRFLEHRPDMFTGGTRPLDLDQTRFVLTTETCIYASATELSDVIFAEHLSILDPAALPLGPIPAAANEQETPSDDHIVVPGYVLGKRLGAGGSGEVFIAHEDWENGIGRAIKILSPHPLGDGKDPAIRFASEVRALRVLQHRAIVRYVHSGWTEGKRHLFVVMELVEGDTLKVAAPEMSHSARVAVMTEILDGLQHAHDQGIFHRDIKPSNVVVRRSDQQPVLVDFGLAFHTDDDETRTSSMVGTPGYIAFEAADDPKKSRTAKNDLYACGVTLYELLAGRRPKLDQYQRLAEIDGSLAPLDSVVRRALAPERSRYALASEMAADLRKWSRGAKVPAGFVPSPGAAGMRARIAEKHGSRAAPASLGGDGSLDRIIQGIDQAVSRAGRAAFDELATLLTDVVPALKLIDSVPAPHPFIGPICALQLGEIGVRVVLARCSNTKDPLAVGAKQPPISWTKLSAKQVPEVCWTVFLEAPRESPGRLLVATIAASLPIVSGPGRSAAVALHGAAAAEALATPRALADDQEVKDFLFKSAGDAVERLVGGL